MALGGFSPAAKARIREAVRRSEADAPLKRSASFGRREIGGAGTPVRRLRLMTVENDYLVCRPITDDDAPDMEAEEVLVAKPRELRHDMKYYIGVTELATITTQVVNVTAPAGTERWWTVPRYVVHGQSSTKEASDIYAVATGDVMEVEIEGEPVEITLIDLNVAGRVWGSV